MENFGNISQIRRFARFWIEIIKSSERKADTEFVTLFVAIFVTNQAA